MSSSAPNYFQNPGKEVTKAISSNAMQGTPMASAARSSTACDAMPSVAFWHTSGENPMLSGAQWATSTAAVRSSTLSCWSSRYGAESPESMGYGTLLGLCPHKYTSPTVLLTGLWLGPASSWPWPNRCSGGHQREKWGQRISQCVAKEKHLQSASLPGSPCVGQAIFGLRQLQQLPRAQEK